MNYTALALIGVAAAVLLDVVVLRTRLVSRRLFWVSYAIVLGFQLVVNGVLTGRRVVTYNGSSILGGSRPAFFGNGRIVYAPVEDVLFGFSLMLQTLAWWVWWGRRVDR